MGANPGIDTVPQAHWKRLQSRGAHPCRRDCHTSIYHDGDMYMFGGWTDEAKMGDLHCYRLETQEWLILDTKGKCPAVREGHSAVIWDGKMIVFGGQGEDQNFHDCYAFDFSTKTWEFLDACMETDVTGSLSSSSENDSNRDSVGLQHMGERFYHTAVMYKNSMYVFGGCDDDHTFDEFYELNLLDLKWRAIPGIGTPPSRRYCHTSVVYSGSMFVFGGCQDERNFNDMYEFSFATQDWRRVEYRGAAIPPCPRYGHVCNVDEQGNFMLLYGGCVESLKFDCTYLFLFDERTWLKLHPAPPPIEVAGHTCIYVDGKGYVFGGSSDEEAFSDVFELALDWSWVAKQRAIGSEVTYPYQACEGIGPPEREEIEDDEDEDDVELSYDDEGEEGEEEEEDEAGSPVNSGSASSLTRPVIHASHTHMTPIDPPRPPLTPTGPDGRHPGPSLDITTSNLSTLNNRQPSHSSSETSYREASERRDTNYTSSRSSGSYRPQNLFDIPCEATPRSTGTVLSNAQQSLDFSTIASLDMEAGIRVPTNKEGRKSSGSSGLPDMGTMPLNPELMATSGIPPLGFFSDYGGRNSSPLPNPPAMPNLTPSDSMDVRIDDLQRQLRRYQDQVKAYHQEVQERYDEDRRHWERRITSLFQQYFLPQHQHMTQMTVELRRMQLQLGQLSEIQQRFLQQMEVNGQTSNSSSEFSPHHGRNNGPPSN